MAAAYGDDVVRNQFSFKLVIFACVSPSMRAYFSSRHLTKNRNHTLPNRRFLNIFGGVRWQYEPARVHETGRKITSVPWRKISHTVVKNYACPKGTNNMMPINRRRNYKNQSRNAKIEMETLKSVEFIKIEVEIFKSNSKYLRRSSNI